MITRRLLETAGGTLSLLLFACAADPNQLDGTAGRQRLLQQVQVTFDELSRPGGACLSGRLGNDQSCESDEYWQKLLSETCSARGLQVEQAASAVSCGAEKFRFSEFSCCPASAQTVLANCASAVEGGPTSCRPVADWKQVMTDACTAQGQRLGEVFFGASCGTDAVRSVNYQCCSEQPAPPPADDCQPFTDGDAATCRTGEDWKRTVTAACTGKGLMLSDLSLRDTCGSGSYRAISYLCCGARPTPPPVPTCSSTVYETPGCRDESGWLTVAADLCVKQGLQLDAIGFSDECSSGVWKNMKYACCPATTTPPPPPPSDCTTQILGDGTACNDQATWRDQAVRACAATATRLTALTFGSECGSAKYSAAKVSCCK